MNEGVLLAIIGGIFTLATAITGGIFQRGNKEKQREKERNAEVRKERNKKDAIERKKNREHDALARQLAWHLLTGNSENKLQARFDAAEQSEKEWAEAERLFYERLDEIEAQYK